MKKEIKEIKLIYYRILITFCDSLDVIARRFGNEYFCKKSSQLFNKAEMLISKYER